MVALELQIGGGGGQSARPGDKGGPVAKNFFSAPRASVWSKNSGGTPGPPGCSSGSSTTFQLTFTSDEGGSLTGVPPAVIGASISLSYLRHFVCSM